MEDRVNSCLRRILPPSGRQDSLYDVDCMQETLSTLHIVKLSACLLVAILSRWTFQLLFAANDIGPGSRSQPQHLRCSPAAGPSARK